MSKNIQSSKILDLLKGKWSLDRKLINKINKSLSGTASGTSEFTEDKKNSLLYKEAVSVHFNNGFESHSTASYKFQIEDGKLNQCRIISSPVESKEGYMFELNFFSDNSNILASSSYICGKDNYRVEYIISNNNKFVITYTVLGPEKNYTTETKFQRIEIADE